MLRRRVPFSQLVMATLIGVAGGLYIYRPYFNPELKRSARPEQKEGKKGKELEP